MAFAQDLLKQAFHLLNKESKNPTQASLRRSVSTAYYALFHLLIQDASANWSRADTRDYLARAFEHRTMKQACTWAENATYDPAISLQVVAKLRSVARAFRELQLQRHLADYSNATKWDRIKASAKVNQAKTAFSDWKSIRNEFVAQKYLVSLLSNYKEE
ncbi:MAG: hypothetical protein ABSG13_31015 [Bryobacteraceae bacterium]|jgi:hypothetical protein